MPEHDPAAATTEARPFPRCWAPAAAAVLAAGRRPAHSRQPDGAGCTSGVPDAVDCRFPWRHRRWQWWRADRSLQSGLAARIPWLRQSLPGSGWFRRAAAQLRRCGEALRASADPSRQHAFAKALAVPALTALPKPVAIVVQDPSRLDPLTLEILRRMRQNSGATAIGIVHWIIFTHAGQDPAAAASLLGTTDRVGAAVPAEPPCVLSWRAGTGVPQP